MPSQEAIVVSGKRLSLVWIFPVLALLLAGWMLLHKELQKGPLITIHLETAEGIIAGKTQVQVRSVPIGTVTDVELGEDYKGVIVKARIGKAYTDLLAEDSRLWIVKPRIGRGGISGLGTILSGSYIEFVPGESQVHRYEFQGMSTPPIQNDDGHSIVSLESESAFTLNVGDPVLFRGFEAGRIINTGFDPTRLRFTYSLSLQPQFTGLITINTRFWMTHAVDMSLDSKGVSLRLASLESLLNGGISFDILKPREESNPVAQDHRFKLYESYDAMIRQPYQFAARYLLMFDNSVRGLNVGSPVEYRGLQIGSVEEISISYIEERVFRPAEAIPIPVLIRIDPGRFPYGDTQEGLQKLMDDIKLRVEAGMRARLSIGSLLTGGLYIDFNYFENADPVHGIDKVAGYPVIPTLGSSAGEIEDRVLSILKSIDQLPLGETFSEVQTSLDQLQSIGESLRNLITGLEPALSETATTELIEALTRAAASLNDSARDWSKHAPVYLHLNESLLAIRNAVVEIEALASKLNAKPNALVFPTSPTLDPEPPSPRK
ncbi:MAG: MlaD family protein [Opitutales bacterium]|nr:MlaD family protein [Opitutales bacterium]